MREDDFDHWEEEDRRSHFESILFRYWPEGWALRWHSRAHTEGFIFWHTETGRRVITIPRPTSRQALWTGLHEVAHATLGHFTTKPRRPSFLEEYECEQWARGIMRLEGIPVPREVVEEAKRYVRSKLEEDRPERVPRRVREWLRQR